MLLNPCLGVFMDTAIVFYFLSLNGTSRVEIAEGFTHALSPFLSLGINLAPNFTFSSNMFLTFPALFLYGLSVCSS